MSAEIADELEAARKAYERWGDIGMEQDPPALTNYISALETALYAKDMAGGWQPIETAPKDTAILLAITGFVAVGRWLDNTDTPWPWKGWSTNMGPHSEAYVRAWMPLPAPPSSLPNKEDRNG